MIPDDFQKLVLGMPTDFFKNGEDYIFEREAAAGPSRLAGRRVAGSDEWSTGDR